MHEGSRRAIFAAFLANLGIAVAKFVAFAFTRSASMLAEAIHSVADTGNQGLLFLGGARSRRRPSTTHQFGYGRERFFWAFIVALVLFLLGGAFAIYEGIEKLRHPHEIESLWWAVGVLLIALVMEGFSLRTAVQEADKVRGDHGWVAFIRRAKAPEIPVVLLEDVGALTGLVLALSGVSLAKVTGDPRWDALGSLAIGILLCVIAIVLAAEMKSLLIGEAASPGAEAAIRDAFAGADGVRGIIHLRTEHVGPEDLLVAAKLEFDRSLSMADLAAAIDGAEVRVRAAVPDARFVFVEPDLRRPEGATGEETPADPHG
ncbi:MAG: cation diffusion facilitator family transporter [Acidimicrobiales bacterium]|nr:cation diffusion facilitator family transporter [Acidimicrobiales bacterium]